jgi:hypothetical protein
LESKLSSVLGEVWLYSEDLPPTEAEWWGHEGISSIQYYASSTNRNVSLSKKKMWKDKKKSFTGDVTHYIETDLKLHFSFFSLPFDFLPVFLIQYNNCSTL